MLERKYCATYIDAKGDMTYAATQYELLGQDLESLSEELNPDVETKTNILGESSVVHNGFKPTADVDPFYADYKSSLAEKLREIAMNRETGDKCKSSVVWVWLEPPALSGGKPTVKDAYREDVMLVPTSVGGDTSGTQIPFTIQYCGNRVKGSFDIGTKKFTADGAGA